MSEFKGKTAIVTGGSAGIGRSTAMEFAARGANVTVADVLEDEGRETIEAIEQDGGKAIFVRTDVSKTEDVQEMVRRTVDEFGGLNYCCNNAGIEGKQVPLAEGTEENWNKVIGINLTGVWLCMKYQIPEVLKTRGAIVNMSSAAGLVGFHGMSAYVASKHGVIGLTRAAALEYAPRGIRINTICPGVIRTAMVDRVIGGDKDIEQQFVSMEPIGRMGDPVEVARAVLWLCSEESSYVVGHPLSVDGGMVIQ